MPYDPNYPYGTFNPYGNYPARQNTNTYAFVNGLEGAKSFIVQPNQTVLLMDSDHPVCYMKSANGIGQSSLRYFKLVEVSENDIRNLSNPVPVSPTPGIEYATKDDLRNLLARIEKLEPKEVKGE